MSGTLLFALAISLPLAGFGLIIGGLCDRLGISSRSREAVWTLALCTPVLALAASVALQFAGIEITTPTLGASTEFAAQQVESSLPPAAVGAASEASGDADQGAAPSSEYRIGAGETTGPARAFAFWLPLQPMAIGVWMAGTILSLAWLGLRLARLEGLRRASNPIEDAELVGALKRRALELGVSPPALRRVQAHLATPLLAGIRRPSILLPAELAEGATQAELMLICAHELAHLKRGDNLRILAEEILSALLWFNPLTHATRRRLDLVREERCDAAALAGAENGLRKAYARKLVQAIGRDSWLSPWPALIGRKEGLAARRLRSILSPTDGPGAPKWTALALAALLGSATIAAGVAVAQPGAAPDAAPRPDYRTPLSDEPMDIRFEIQMIEVRLTDEARRLLPGLTAEGNAYVIGGPGEGQAMAGVIERLIAQGDAVAVSTYHEVARPYQNVRYATGGTLPGATIRSGDQYIAERGARHGFTLDVNSSVALDNRTSEIAFNFVADAVSEPRTVDGRATADWLGSRRYGAYLSAPLGGAVVLGGVARPGEDALDTYSAMWRRRQSEIVLVIRPQFVPSQSQREEAFADPEFVRAVQRTAPTTTPMRVRFEMAVVSAAPSMLAEVLAKPSANGIVFHQGVSLRSTYADGPFTDFSSGTLTDALAAFSRNELSARALDDLAVEPGAQATIRIPDAFGRTTVEYETISQGPRLSAPAVRNTNHLVVGLAPQVAADGRIQLSLSMTALERESAHGQRAVWTADPLWGERPPAGMRIMGFPDGAFLEPADLAERWIRTDTPDAVVAATTANIEVASGQVIAITYTGESETPYRGGGLGGPVLLIRPVIEPQ
jgi:beta-lactamase regulating signal transducer with metallopeptidase domain